MTAILTLIAFVFIWCAAWGYLFYWAEGKA